MPDSRHLQLPKVAMQGVHDRVGITQTNYYFLPVMELAQTDFTANVR